MFKRTLVTSALPYANGPLHLGHLSGAYLPADIFVRYRRLKNDDIVFICGSDEHGVAITIAADKLGLTPQQVVDKYHEINKKAFEDFGISFDHYGRTSAEIHHKTSQEFFLKLHEKGIFKQKTESQLFDEAAGMFLPDRYVKGTCPVCSFDEAYGDQCEKCGTSLSPTDLKNPKSTITGNSPILKETSHWYLPLGDMQPFVESWISGKTQWKNHVLGQIKSWLTAGLSDRAITRDLTWGVKVPLPNTEGKVLYVWLDAPIGYISATKEWAIQKGNVDAWKPYWMDQETQLLHFIGKDNIVFHCIMFPAILNAHGDFILPDNVPANEFLNLEGRKFSTSRGWAVWLHEVLDQFEPDYMRYALACTLPETKDADFSWADFQARVNNELADILGNFLFRTLSFTERYFEGKVPEPKDLLESDQAILHEIKALKARITDHYEAFRLRDAIAETMNMARLGNKYFTDKEPWKTRKSNEQDCANALFVCLQVAASLSIAFEPIIPFKMQQLRSQLDISTYSWNEIGDSIMQPGTSVQLGDILFKKVEDDIIQAQLAKLHSTDQSAPTPSRIEHKPLKPEISFDDFQKLDLRIGKVLSAESVPKSKKLLRLRVDIGLEQRTIMSGIAQHISPEEIVGKQVLLIANLAPRVIMGEESCGMLLLAEDHSQTLHPVFTVAEQGSTVA